MILLAFDIYSNSHWINENISLNLRKDTEQQNQPNFNGLNKSSNEHNNINSKSQQNLSIKQKYRKHPQHHTEKKINELNNSQHGRVSGFESELSIELNNKSDLIQEDRSPFYKIDNEEDLIRHNDWRTRCLASPPSLMNSHGPSAAGTVGISSASGQIQPCSQPQQQQQLIRKKTPRRLMKAINLLVNVKSFYNKITRNTRIFTKITEEQYRLINDKSSQYSADLVVLAHSKSITNSRKTSLLHSFIKPSLISIRSAFTRCLERVPVIQPYDKLKILWDSIQALAIILLIFYFSMVIVFHVETAETDYYYKFLEFSLLLFMLDMLVQFNTGVILKGVVVEHRTRIAVMYLRSNFVMDVIGMLPILLESAGKQYELNPLLSSLIKACILFKCFILRDIFERIEQRFGHQKNLENIIDLMKLLFTIGCICHFFALVWIVIGESSIDYQSSTVTGTTSSSNNNSNNSNTSNCSNCVGGSSHISWMITQGIQDADVYTKYIYSFYFIVTTMITVGYGDISPTNTKEIVFAIATMFLTGVVYAYSLNCIGNILENINEVNKDFRNDMRTIHHMMEKQGVRQALRVRVSNYIEYLCKESNQQAKQKQDAIVDKLSHQLKQELMEEIKGKLLTDIPLFSEILTAPSKEKIINEMEECLFSPGEVIFSHDSEDDCSIFYVLKGSVNISLLHSDSHPIASIEKRGCFGEISFLTGNRRNGTAIATDFCRIYRIKRDAFMQIIRSNEHDWENFKMMYEAIVLKHNLKFARIRCYSCSRGDHLAHSCPKTHLVLTKSNIIQKYNNSIDAIRVPTFQRSITRPRSHSPITSIDVVQESIYRLHLNTDNFEIIAALERIAHLNDSYLDLHFSDEEDPSMFETIQHQNRVRNRVRSSMNEQIDYQLPDQERSQTLVSGTTEQNEENAQHSRKDSHNTSTSSESSSSSSLRSSKLHSAILVEECTNEKITETIQRGSLVSSIKKRFKEESEENVHDDDDFFGDPRIDQPSSKAISNNNNNNSNNNRNNSNNPSSENRILRQSNRQLNMERLQQQQGFTTKLAQYQNEDLLLQQIRKSSHPILFVSHTGNIDCNSKNEYIVSNDPVCLTNTTPLLTIKPNLTHQNSNNTGKPLAPHYRKSVSFDPNQLSSVQQHYYESLNDGSHAGNSKKREQSKQQQQKNAYHRFQSSLQSLLVRQKSPSQHSISRMQSALKSVGSSSLGSQVHLNLIKSLDENVSPRQSSSQSKIFKRSSTKTNCSKMSIHSQAAIIDQQQNNSLGCLVSPQMAARKSNFEQRKPLSQREIQLIQLNEQQLKQIYYQQNGVTKTLWDIGASAGVGIERDAEISSELLFVEFDAIKNYKYYYPQFNIQKVIVSFSQHQQKKFQAAEIANVSHLAKPATKGNRHKRNKKIHAGTPISRDSYHQKDFNEFSDIANNSSIPVTMRNSQKNQQLTLVHSIRASKADSIFSKYHNQN